MDEALIKGGHFALYACTVEIFQLSGVEDRSSVCIFGQVKLLEQGAGGEW